MSQADDTPETGASRRPDIDSRRPPAAGIAPRRGGTLALALLLSLLAIGGAGFTAWRQYRHERGSMADSQALEALQQRVGTLEGALAASSNERNALRQRLNDTDQVNRSVRDELLSQGDRTRNLEDAVTKLSEKTLSAHNTLLLDETESLLRMAKERYELFHDGEAAAAAYALADQTLAAVDDGAFSSLRQSITAERDALLRSAPASLHASLDAIDNLRASMDTLPLKPLDQPADTTQATGWSRVLAALGEVVKVQRSNGAPLAVADARFARELASLDLAQAQAALLAHDRDSAAAALHRVDAALSTQFDTQSPAVQQARTQIAALLAQQPAVAPVKLGVALDELRNLRAVHALKPIGTKP